MYFCFPSTRREHTERQCRDTDSRCCTVPQELGGEGDGVDGCWERKGEGRKEAAGRLNPDTCAWDWKVDRRPGVYVGNCEKPLSVTAPPEVRGLTLCDWTPRMPGESSTKLFSE